MHMLSQQWAVRNCMSVCCTVPFIMSWHAGWLTFPMHIFGLCMQHEQANWMRKHGVPRKIMPLDSRQKAAIHECFKYVISHVFQVFTQQACKYASCVTFHTIQHGLNSAQHSVLGKTTCAQKFCDRSVKVHNTF